MNFESWIKLSLKERLRAKVSMTWTCNFHVYSKTIWDQVFVPCNTKCSIWNVGQLGAREGICWPNHTVNKLQIWHKRNQISWYPVKRTHHCLIAMLSTSLGTTNYWFPGKQMQQNGNKNSSVSVYYRPSSLLWSIYGI